MFGGVDGTHVRSIKVRESALLQTVESRVYGRQIGSLREGVCSVLGLFARRVWRLRGAEAKSAYKRVRLYLFIVRFA